MNTPPLVLCLVVEALRGNRSRRTATVSLTLDDDGFVAVDFEEGRELGVEEIDEVLSRQVELAQEYDGAFVGILADVTPIRSTSWVAVQRTVTDPISDRTAAVDVLANSPVARVLGGLFMLLKNRPFPVRLFRDEEEARGWLRNQIATRGS